MSYDYNRLSLLDHKNTEELLKDREQTIERLTAELNAAKITVSDIEDKLLEEEKNRRRLHNTIQELKGNIRVFCRIRPVLGKQELSHSNDVYIHYSHLPFFRHREEVCCQRYRYSLSRQRKESA